MGWGRGPVRATGRVYGDIGRRELTSRVAWWVRHLTMKYSFYRYIKVMNIRTISEKYMISIS